jgi:DnaJ domain
MFIKSLKSFYHSKFLLTGNLSLFKLSTLLLLSFNTFSQTALSENVEIYGLKFNANFNKTSQAGLLEYFDSEDNKSFIKESDLKKEVLADYFENRDFQGLKSSVAQFRKEEITKFTSKSLKNHDYQTAKYGILSLIAHPEVSIDTINVFFEKNILKLSLQGKPSVFEIFFELEKKLSSWSITSDKMNLFSYYTGISNPEWGKKYHREHTELELENITSLAIENITDLIFDSESGLATQILKRLKLLLERKSDIYNPLKIIVKELPQSLISLEKSDEQNSKFTEVRFDWENEALNDKVNPRLAEACTKKIQVLNDKGYFKRSINILSQIPAKYQSPESINLGVYALDKIPPSTQPIFINPTVKKYLLESSKQNINFRFSFIGYLTRNIESSFSLDESNSKSGLYMGVLEEVNPDPNPINDQLRIKWAKYYEERGFLSEAIKKLAEIKGSLSIGEKLWLAYYQLSLYSSLFKYAILWSGLLLLAIATFLLSKNSFLGIRKVVDTFRQPNRINRGVFEEKSGEKNQNSSNPSEEDIPLFVRGHRGTAQNPLVIEYVECLALLELKIGVSLKDIKKAYRKLMKVYHPDKSSNNQDTKETFMGITKAYQRLVEIEEKQLISEQEKAAMFKSAKV